MNHSFRQFLVAIIAGLFICSGAFADVVVYSENFEDETVGATISQNGFEFGNTLNMRNTVTGEVITGNATIPTQVLELTVGTNNFAAIALQNLVADGFVAAGETITIELDVFEAVDDLSNVQFRSNESGGSANRIRDQFNPTETMLGTNYFHFEQQYTLPLVDAGGNAVTQHEVFIFFGATADTNNFAYVDNIVLTNNSRAVPEPGMFGLLTTALAGLCVARRRRK